MRRRGRQQPWHGKSAGNGRRRRSLVHTSRNGHRRRRLVHISRKGQRRGGLVRAGARRNAAPAEAWLAGAGEHRAGEPGAGHQRHRERIGRAPVAGRRRQVRGAGEDLPVQPLELRAGLDAELTAQPAADVAEHLQRVTSLAAPVQGHHQHPGQPLRQRVPGQQGGQLRGRLALQAAVEQAADAIRCGPQVLFRQRRADRLDPGRAPDVGQGRPSPQRQGQIERRQRRLPVRRRTSRLGQRPELMHICLARLNLQPVAVPVSLELAAGHPRQRLAQAGHQDLKAAARRARRLLLPYRVDQLVDRHDLPGPQREHGQHQALLRLPRRRPGVMDQHLDRSEQPQDNATCHPASPADIRRRLDRNVL